MARRTWSRQWIGTWRLGLAALLLVVAPAGFARTRSGSLHSGPARLPLPSDVSGRVFEDRNANGVQDSGEPGMTGVRMELIAESTGVAVDSARTDAGGDFSLAVPREPGRRVPMLLQCIPAAGCYPVGASVRAASPGRNVDFGLATFRRMSLSARNVLCLGRGDLMEKDWAGAQAAHRDLDLIAGADANGTDQLSVWFNHFDANPLFDDLRTYPRTAPNAVLSMAVDSLATTRASRTTRAAGPARADVVTGTRHSSAGNLFTWLTQSRAGSQGFLPSSYTQACRTHDDGDVQAVVTGEVTGDGATDILAGTRSPGGTRGTVELWANDGAASPAFAMAQRYPAEGARGDALGEVCALALATLGDESGRAPQQPDGAAGLVAGTTGVAGRRLVVGTRTGVASGQLVVLACNRGSFEELWQERFDHAAITAVCVTDITGDGRADIVVATRTGPDRGQLELWRNDSAAGRISFTRTRAVPVSGIPCTLAAADFGGLAGMDIAVGFRGRDSSVDGRVEIYYCDAHTLPLHGSDPAAGRITNWVSAMVSGDFHTSLTAPASAPRTDLAVGVHGAPGSGAVVLLIR